MEGNDTRYVGTVVSFSNKGGGVSLFLTTRPDKDNYYRRGCNDENAVYAQWNVSPGFRKHDTAFPGITRSKRRTRCTRSKNNESFYASRGQVLIKLSSESDRYRVRVQRVSTKKWGGNGLMVNRYKFLPLKWNSKATRASQSIRILLLIIQGNDFLGVFPRLKRFELFDDEYESSRNVEHPVFRGNFNSSLSIINSTYFDNPKLMKLLISVEFCWLLSRKRGIMSFQGNECWKF